MLRELHFPFPTVVAASIPVFSVIVGLLSGGFRDRRAPLRLHLAVGLLSVTTAVFSNMALMYLTYPVQIVMKSSKLLPVMFVGFLFWKRRFSVLQCVAALCLVAGLSVFILADVNVSPEFNVVGIFLLVVALFADAFLGNVQEGVFSVYQARQNEASSWAMLFASIVSVALVAIRERDMLSYSGEASFRVFWGIVVYAACNWAGLFFILTVRPSFPLL